MIVYVKKSKTVQNGEGYDKVEYALESDEVSPSNLENTRQSMEATLDLWLKDSFGQTNTNTTEQSLPEKGRGICSKCGKPVKPPYKLCYKCFIKRNQ